MRGRNQIGIVPGCLKTPCRWEEDEEWVAFLCMTGDMSIPDCQCGLTSLTFFPIALIQKLYMYFLFPLLSHIFLSLALASCSFSDSFREI